MASKQTLTYWRWRKTTSVSLRNSATREEPFKALAHLLVREMLAALERFRASTHCLNEEVFLIEIPRHDFLYQFAGIRPS